LFLYLKSNQTVGMINIRFDFLRLWGIKLSSDRLEAS